MATIYTLSRAMNLPRCRPSLLSGLAETWWNSSTAINRLSNASTPNLSTAKRKVAWVQTSTLSSLSRKAPTVLTLPPSSPGALQRFHFGVTVQSAQTQNWVSGSSEKLEPMLFSGTTMIACFTPWLTTLSNETNLRERLLPDTEGDLHSKYFLTPLH